jgi:hypothetical protein
MKGFKAGFDERRNIAGRPRGAKNKNPEELRSLLNEFLHSNFATVQKRFDGLDPKDQLLFYERLLKHILAPPVLDISKLNEQQLDDLLTRIKNYDYDKGNEDETDYRGCKSA